MGFIVAAATIMVLGLLWALRAVFLVCRDAGEEDTLFDQVLLAVPTAALSECSRQAESMFETAEAGLRPTLKTSWEPRASTPFPCSSASTL